LTDRHACEQKYTAGLTGKTERTLAERVGHLEMLEGPGPGHATKERGPGKGKGGK